MLVVARRTARRTSGKQSNTDSFLGRKGTHPRMGVDSPRDFLGFFPGKARPKYSWVASTRVLHAQAGSLPVDTARISGRPRRSGRRVCGSDTAPPRHSPGFQVGWRACTLRAQAGSLPVDTARISGRPRRSGRRVCGSGVTPPRHSPGTHRGLSDSRERALCAALCAMLFVGWRSSDGCWAGASLHEEWLEEAAPAMGDLLCTPMGRLLCVPMRGECMCAPVTGDLLCTHEGRLAVHPDGATCVSAPTVGRLACCTRGGAACCAPVMAACCACTPLG